MIRAVSESVHHGTRLGERDAGAAAVKDQLTALAAVIKARKERVSIGQLANPQSIRQLATPPSPMACAMRSNVV